MAQDFAKKRNPTAKPRNKPARAATRNAEKSTGHWSWFTVGFLSGILICVTAYFAFSAKITSHSQPDISSAQPQPEESNTAADMEFFDYLPQAEVEVSVVPVDVAEPGQADETPVTYLLQAGSFQDPNDAEALRARIILLNLEARIQPVTISGRTWYRVQAGPFTGRAVVGAAENTLIQNNIDPIRLRIPSQ